MKNIFIALLIFTIISCCSWSTSICVINKSRYNYLGCYSYTDSFGNNNMGYDNIAEFDTCKQKSLEWLRFAHKYCHKGDTLYLKFQTRSFDEIFEKSIDGKVRFFFIKDSVYLNTPWDSIVKYQICDKKYIFNKKEFNQIGQKIVLK